MGYLEEVKITEQLIQTEQQLSIRKLYSLFRGDFPKVAQRKQTCNNQGALKWLFTLNIAATRKTKHQRQTSILGSKL
ncbi:hypothetical protein RDI58_010780 [Solanum bulbocastanum]|uniref:Uncharacterized protein n=1 Tax=Solanum bulbocastanum TaxID=147425 RepID=A0AAN8TQ30_SOLBU